MTEPATSSTSTQGILNPLDSSNYYVSTKKVSGEAILFALVILVVFVLLLTRTKRWSGFATRHKIFSRFILFVFILQLALVISGVSNWVHWRIPVEVTQESPHLNATGSKIVLYDYHIEHELTQLLPGKEVVLKCIQAVSWAEETNLKSRCNDDLSCLDQVPLVSRDTIIAKIKESQSKNIAGVSDLCKSVDVTKL